MPASFLELDGAWDVPYGFAEQQGLTGGRGRPVHVVTSAADAGPGTYREALAGGDRYITFAPELDGVTIRLQSPVSASGSNLTLDGSGVDVTVSGYATKFSGTNIVVAGMAYRSMTATSNEDAITFRSPATTQVFGVYGSVFETATDGLIDVIWNDGHDVYGTICGNVFRHHDKAMLIHSGNPDREGGTYHVTLCRNAWTDVYQRAPLSRDALVHQYNSVFEDYGKADGAGGGSKSGADLVPSQHFLENNVARPRAVGDVTWTGDVVTKPRTEFAGPHASSLGSIRIDGSLLLANGDRRATELENRPGSVFTPTYAYPLVPASATMRQAVKASAGACAAAPARRGALVDPCAVTTFVARGDAVVFRGDGTPVSVEVFLDGSSIGFATPTDGGWRFTVDLPTGTVGTISAVATNADGSTVASDAAPVAVL